MQWRPGDFIISDNLALAHEASPDTQLPRQQVVSCNAGAGSAQRWRRVAWGRRPSVPPLLASHPPCLLLRLQGLRVMHRTTIQGYHKPQKRSSGGQQQQEEPDGQLAGQRPG